jgi:hypothetical protein
MFRDGVPDIVNVVIFHGPVPQTVKGQFMAVLDCMRKQLELKNNSKTARSVIGFDIHV